MECNYDELRRDSCIVDVEELLFAEQGGICAYTGMRLNLIRQQATEVQSRIVDFHIEHLIPQAYCNYGQDAEYTNMVACWPRPNIGYEPQYGARKKGNWPTLTMAAQFVSPLRSDCSHRLLFNHRGEVESLPGDEAAAATIQRLGLDHKSLIALRLNAIRGALAPRGKPISLPEAKRLLSALDKQNAELDAGANVRLPEFSFAIRPAVDREVRKLQAIVNRQ